ncbi:MAG: iron chaperone [bacterium]
MKTALPKTIDEYIAGFPRSTQKLLKSVRNAIKDTAPQAEETIRYQMPTFRLNDTNLVHFAGFERHIGLYPTPSAIVGFKRELSRYKSAKGSVQFPIEESMPLALIRAIVQFRVDEVTR